MDVVNPGGRLKFPNGLVLEHGLNKGVSKSDFAACNTDHLSLEVLEEVETPKKKKTSKKAPKPEPLDDDEATPSVE